MPEPYKTYVRQRSESVASVLGEVMGDVDVQLCPRHITPDEQIFTGSDTYVYGAVVRDMRDGYKSILYSDKFSGQGVATSDPQEAVAYAEEQFSIGNRVRLKDPRASDGQGQQSAETTDELIPAFYEIVADSDAGCVIMPHLDKVLHRISVGELSLGAIGKFNYLGVEKTTTHDGTEVYGGTTLGLFSDTLPANRSKVERHLDIPPRLTMLGQIALETYSGVALDTGRISVDVVEGVTDNGDILRDVIDITPRMGGTTPAEVLALRAVHQANDSICYASSELIYDPAGAPSIGVNFIDTDTLVINGRIEEVRL